MNEQIKIPAKSPTSSGVEALIARLRDQGVAKGRDEAAKLVTDARKRADWLVQQARQEAEALLGRARDEADRFEHAGKEALRVALRDTVLEMQQTLSGQVSDAVRRLISQQLKDEAFLQRLILEVAGRAREEAGVDHVAHVKILLPQDVMALDDLRRRPDELQEGTLTHFVLAVAGEVLLAGVTFGVAEDDANGIRVRLVGQGIEVELTDRTIAEVLLQHLQPRFRAVLEGVIQ